MRPRTSGFTLLEVLVVIAVIGILLTVLYAFSAGALYRTQVRDGAVQLLADLKQARSQAQKTSQSSVVELASAAPSFVPAPGYTTTWGGGAAVSRALPGGVKVAPVVSDGKISYTAPFGEVDPTGTVWAVSSPRTAYTLYLKIVGVTGKVMLSATPD